MRFVRPGASRRCSAPPSWPRADTPSRCGRSIASEGAGFRPGRKPIAPGDDGSGDRPAENLLERSAVSLLETPGFRAPPPPPERPKPVVLSGRPGPECHELGQGRSAVRILEIPEPLRVDPHHVSLASRQEARKRSIASGCEACPITGGRLNWTDSLRLGRVDLGGCPPRCRVRR